MCACVWDLLLLWTAWYFINILTNLILMFADDTINFVHDLCAAKGPVSPTKPNSSNIRYSWLMHRHHLKVLCVAFETLIVKLVVIACCKWGWWWWWLVASIPEHWCCEYLESIFLIKTGLPLNFVASYRACYLFLTLHVVHNSVLNLYRSSIGGVSHCVSSYRIIYSDYQ